MTKELTEQEARAIARNLLEFVMDEIDRNCEQCAEMLAKQSEKRV